MNLPEFGVRKPVTNLMIFCAILVIALYSITKLGIDMFPKIEPPSISVIAAYPGANPLDVEAKVTEPLENQLGTTPGLEKITSRSMEGMSSLSLKFKWGTNLDEASNDIRDRIELAKRFLPDIPDEMDNPFIFKFNTANIPIVFLGVTAKETYPELYELVDKRIGDALRQLPGVGAVQIQGGGLQRQINIWLDSGTLEGYNLSIIDIQNILKQENVTQPVGSIKAGLTDYLLRLLGEFTSPDEINSVIIGKKDNKFVYLKDIARVEDGFKEVDSIVRVNRNPGIMIMVQKQSGTNTVEVAETVKKKLEELKKTLPRDVNIVVIFDTSKDIINSLDSLKSSVWVAVLLVIFVVWFFLRQISPSLIIALTIPFSLLISFIYLFLSGKTINIISLSSLAIVSGMVVDNAIVVVDNIYRHMERGQRPVEASIYGTSEMFFAIAASTLTTVVVFVPMLFITGVTGIMFKELAVIIIVTLIASLFTAATFSPMLCSKWMRIRKKRKGLVEKIYSMSENMFRSWENIYAALLRQCLRHKKIVLIGFSAVFIASLFLTRFIGNEFSPEEDSGDIRISVSLPLGTRVEETDKVAKVIEGIFKEEAPEALYSYVRSGQVSGIGRSFGQSSGTHIIAAGVKLIPKTQRHRSVEEVAQILRKRFVGIPGVIKTDVTTGNPIGRIVSGMGGKAVQVEIIGNSFEDTDEFAANVKQMIEKVPGAVDVTISRELRRPELKIQVDRQKAANFGLNMNTIASSLKSYIEGSTATKYRERGETYDIYVRLEEGSRSRIEDIENLTVVSPYTNKHLKFSNFAKIEEALGPVQIERLNRERVVKVECNTYGRSTGKVVEDIKKELTAMPMPYGVMVNFGGDAEEQAKAFKDMGLLLILGIILVYMVMAAQFESLLDPFIVMFSVPFTFTGVLVAFFLTKTTLSIISFLGMVMLMGIVVNNAIVLISYINILRARGLGIIEAVTQSGRERLRPVLMTTVTTLVGLVPLALSRGEGSETWNPLGITMIGGLTVSTFITMLFVPTLYAVFESKLKNKRIVS
ncbi:MAG: acriflavin resistance protein [Candidatus Omnitrophica bacterium CG22_combo_CG10-13_8_21_14_all_43_16]|nr:MAG: acriflavin resistance protein [Candidatus Omnitrophica bacterium CG22_combo_CG10-13_8_21_14_all_43_16]